MSFKVILTLIFLCLSWTGLKAQSLIAGIPSADVCPIKKFEWTHESQFNFWNPKGFKWNSFNFVTYGIAKNTELAFSVINVGAPATNNISVGLGYKHIVPIYPKRYEKYELKWTIGQMAYRGLQTHDFGFWFYSHGSVRLPKTKTRFTGGVSWGSSHVFGFRTVNSALPLDASTVPPQNFDPQGDPNTPICFIGGIEQPVIGNWGLLADWYSGDHEIAALITGVQYKLGHHVLILGYKWDNQRYEAMEQDAIIFETMIHF